MPVPYESAFHSFAARLRALGVMKAAKQITKKHGTNLREVYARDRRPHVVKARYAILWVIRRKFGWSYPSLGKLINRDHSSVMNGMNRYQEEEGAQDVVDQEEGEDESENGDEDDADPEAGEE